LNEDGDLEWLPYAEWSPLHQTYLERRRQQRTTCNDE